MTKEQLAAQLNGRYMVSFTRCIAFSTNTRSAVFSFTASPPFFDATAMQSVRVQPRGLSRSRRPRGAGRCGNPRRAARLRSAVCRAACVGTCIRLGSFFVSCSERGDFLATCSTEAHGHQFASLSTPHASAFGDDLFARARPLCLLHIEVVLAECFTDHVRLVTAATETRCESGVPQRFSFLV